MQTPKTGNEPSLPQPPPGDAPALGGDRKIVMCPKHNVPMLRDLFGTNICGECLQDQQRIGRYGGVHLRERKPSDPEWFYVGKNTPIDQITCVRAGLHPMGFPISPDPAAKCGNCAHLVVKHYGKTYFKCGLVKDSGGYATDIREKWAGCSNWKAKDSEND